MYVEKAFSRGMLHAGESAEVAGQKGGRSGVQADGVGAQGALECAGVRARGRCNSNLQLLGRVVRPRPQPRCNLRVARHV